MTFLLFVVCVTSMRRVGRTSTYLGRLRFVGCESSANLGHAPVADGISRGVSMVLPSGGGPIFGMAAQARHSGPLCIQDFAVPCAARYGAPSRCFRQVFYEHLGMLTFFRPKASYVSIPVTSLECMPTSNPSRFGLDFHQHPLLLTLRLTQTPRPLPRSSSRGLRPGASRPSPPRRWPRAHGGARWSPS